ncbi:MAG: cohesin domain-containing protein [Methylococcales bacterium]
MAACTAQANVVVSVNPISATIGIEQTLNVSIDITGLDVNTALSSYDLSLVYDPTVLHLDNAVFGDPILGDQLDLAHSGLNTPSAAVGPNSINLIEFSLDSSADLLNLQADQFTLATLVFTSLSPGNSPLDLTLSSLADSEANDLTATTLNNSVAVSAVPVPAAFWLFGGGLAVLWAKRKPTK